MKKYLKIIYLGIFIVAFSSCYRDNEEFLYPTPPTPCDTTNVTYSVSIVGSLTNYCLPCHGSTYQTDGGNLRLDNYDIVRKNLYKIVGAIQHDPDYNAMPKNAVKLSDCQINQFVIWQTAGAPNN